MNCFIPPRRLVSTILIIIVVLFVPAGLMAQVPGNDLCIGATPLTSSTTCSNTAGTMKNATATVGIATACGTTATGLDVWYSFVAQTAYPTITVSSMGSNMDNNPRIGIYTNDCVALSSLGCVSGSGVTSLALATSTVIGGVGLTPGQTYLIRVFTSSTSTSSGVSSTWAFDICVTDPVSTNKCDFSRSYINVSDSITGGTIDPGDTLEMRATFIVSAGSFDSLAFYDTLYSGRGYKLLPGSIAFRTNEGKVYKSFTDLNTDTDAGWFQVSGSDTIIRMNLGTVASRFLRGRLNNTSYPRIFGSPCLVMCTYRVVVYAPYNTQIPFKTGKFTARDITTGVVNNINFTQEKLVVFKSPGLCPNATTTNSIGVEFNGTFGTPSNPAPFLKNRGTSAYTFGYTYSPFVTGGGPQDYFYGVTNNTSATWSTTNVLLKPDAGKRVFNLWDIIGDHTGATNTARGNPPCDTTKPISATNPCGYMIVINSAYKADTAFQYTATNLCPNTYYEFSAWFRNMCYKCAADSLGRGPTTAGYIPLAPGDSSGVQPNLAFNVNGLDYYTTGNLRYYGIDLVAPKDTTQSGSDTLNRWVKRGFTYVTGPSETTFTLTIRNNAPGGGGNDWAMDDISVTTCLPNMKYSPSLSPVICAGNAAQINDTVRSYFNNFNYYKWQRSTNNGATWSDVAGASGTASAVWNGTAYEYVTSYTIPPTATNLADSGNKYRVVVATAPSNLADANCQITDGVSQIALSVISCGPMLETQLLSFNGKAVNNHANLSWTTSKENEQLNFHVEKSADGMSWTRIATVKGYNTPNFENNQYTFIDSANISDKSRYRIAMTSNNGRTSYSRVILLNAPAQEFLVSNIVNPFNNEIVFDVAVDKDSKIDATLLNISGNIVKKQTFTVRSGINNFSLDNLKSLPAAIYVLQIQYKDKTVIRKVIKK